MNSGKVTAIAASTTPAHNMQCIKYLSNTYSTEFNIQYVQLKADGSQSNTQDI